MYETSEVEVMTEEPTSPGPFSRDDLRILEENRKLRISLISALAPSGKPPEDKADKTMLINLINGLDAEVMNRARVKVAAKSEENAGNLTALVAKALTQHRVKPSTVSLKEAHVVPSHIKPITLVPGQMDIGVVPITMAELLEDE